MINIFPRNWPRPPKMSRQQYFQYRLKLVAFQVFWVIVLVFMIFYWDSLNIFLKGFFIALGYVFYPTMDTIEQIFVSYERYNKEGLW